MKILFIGDIMGRAGRDALEKYLPIIRGQLKPDVVIVNGENAAHGRGINEKICKSFFEQKVDCITTGNHVWDQRDIIPYIAQENRIIRPINMKEGTPGKGYYLHQTQEGATILIINAMARLFMDPLNDDPFSCVDKLLEEFQLGKNCNAIFVDFHGEATSEKMSFAHYFDGRISGVIGTHTHIPTADAHVLVGGTAYMSDAGMSGDYDSVIGVRKDIGVHKFTKKTPGEKFIPASKNIMLCGAFIQIHNDTGMAQSIEPIRVGQILSETRPL